MRHDRNIGVLQLGASVDPVPEGVAEVATLAGVYIAVTAAGRAQEGSSSRLVTAMANAMSYAGFYAIVAPALLH